ncbi:PDZ domain-containing protein [Alkalicoccus chagannorensis]
MQELLLGAGRFFLHPLTYIAAAVFLLAIFAGIRRERRHFHTRAHDGITVLLTQAAFGLGAGAAASILLVGTGVTLSSALLLMMTVIWLLQLPFRRLRAFSFTVTTSVVILILPMLPGGGTGTVWLDDQLALLQETDLFSLGVLLVTLLFLETVLLAMDGARHPSPSLTRSPRGKVVGEQLLRRMWIMPAFALYPVGGMSGTGAWPLLEAGGFGFVLLPLVLGIDASVRGDTPLSAKRRLTGRMTLLLLSAGVLLAAGWFYPIVVLVLAGVVLAGRELLFSMFESGERTRAGVYVPRNKGLVLMGIIPGTTAEKLGMETGEVVLRVNGKFIRTQRDFYRIMQEQATYVKLEVLDYQGEKRMLQASRYEHDHYLAGCLFLPDNEDQPLSRRGLRSSTVIHEDRRRLGSDEETDDTPAAEEEAGRQESGDSELVYGQAAGMKAFMEEHAPKRRRRDRSSDE